MPTAILTFLPDDKSMTSAIDSCIDKIRDRPEIEITPAMIEVGADILAFYDPEIDRLGETVSQIFRAMLEERLSRRP
jgi:hypothetical protein